MLQFRFLWQISKEKKEADFLITKMAVPFTFYQVFYIIASVVKLSWNSLDASLWSFVIAQDVYKRQVVTTAVICMKHENGI